MGRDVAESKRPWTLGNSTSPDDKSYISDVDGDVVASTHTNIFILDREKSKDVASRAEDNAELIVKAVNMHERLVAHLASLLPDCSIHCNAGSSCDGCPDECETYQLLKEARGDK